MLEWLQKIKEWLNDPYDTPRKIQEILKFINETYEKEESENKGKIEMNITESSYGAVLHKKWIKDPDKENIIIGFWAEDDNEYYIDCPPQIRYDIIKLQNWLSDKYQAIKKAKESIHRLSTFFYGLEDD